MQMYTLPEYSLNFSDTTCISWFYSKDKSTNFNAIFWAIMPLNLSSIRLNIWGKWNIKWNRLRNNEILKKHNNCCTIKESK